MKLSEEQKKPAQVCEWAVVWTCGVWGVYLGGLCGRRGRSSFLSDCSSFGHLRFGGYQKTK